MGIVNIHDVLILVTLAWVISSVLFFQEWASPTSARIHLNTFLEIWSSRWRLLTAVPASFWHCCITIDNRMQNNNRLVTFSRNLPAGNWPRLMSVPGSGSLTRQMERFPNSLYLSHTSISFQRKEKWSSEGRWVWSLSRKIDAATQRFCCCCCWDCRTILIHKDFNTELSPLAASESPAEVGRVRKYLWVCGCLSASRVLIL